MSSYLDKNSGKHVPKKLLSEFRGNFLFASLNQLNFKTTSRRDDLISLFYLLVNLFHGGRLPGFPTKIKRMKTNEKFKIYQELKQSLKYEDLCTGPSKILHEFIYEVSSMRFSDKPRYDQLRLIL